MKGVRDALSRLSGVRSVTVRLQDGLVIAETDPAGVSLPAIWREIVRVGFAPAAMEVRRDGKRFRVVNGGSDPPHFEVIE